jgi:hypothetical protein
MLTLTYEGSITTLVTVNCEKDVGVNIDSNLKFDQHIQTKVNQANQIVAHSLFAVAQKVADP